MKRLCVLGSTGSIGTQTLELVRVQKQRLCVVALAAQRNAERVVEQALEFGPRWVALVDPEAAERVRSRLPASIQVFGGPLALLDLIEASDFDLALHAVVGAAGIEASRAVLQKGAALALANKESLVAAGAALMELSRSMGAPILPVDSEHAAIFQCLQGTAPTRVRRVILTASGGPFRDLALDEFAGITPNDALRHPNWEMGPRISIGSATLMNKALEVIEAHHLFGLAAEQIEVVVHRQSVVHSLVEFVDGSVLAQCGPPDMRGPIHYALHYPERVPIPLAGFSLDLFRQLTFEAPDRSRFPALELGYRCVRAGADSGCVLNAADEVAVAAFLKGELPFTEIVPISAACLEPERRPGAALNGAAKHDIASILESDRSTRGLAAHLIAERNRERSQTGPQPRAPAART